VYGRSKVLPVGTVPLLNCSCYSGKGELAKELGEGNILPSSSDIRLWGWGNFQWLPSNVEVKEHGVKITSYINNLHPEKHSELYKVLEQFVDRSIPLWNEALSWFHSRIRIPLEGFGSDEDYYFPEGLKYPRPSHGNGSQDTGSRPAELNIISNGQGDILVEDEDFEYDNDYFAWKERQKILIQPEPRDFRPRSDLIKDIPAVDLRQKLAVSGLQIIFKLANIHLTPDKPEYDGGTWHVEGALNEHICATAIYYYDQENIDKSGLVFRQSIDAENMMMRPTQVRHFYQIQSKAKLTWRVMMNSSMNMNRLKNTLI
jgi:hypothetical protein